MRRNEIVCALVLACLTAASCGLGSVGAATGLGSGGSSNAPAALSGLAVEGPKTAPATLRFTLADPEGDPTRVELLYRVPGGSLRRVERILAGMPTNPAVLAASPGGQQHSVVWDFAAEPDLPPDASFVPDVLVRAEAPSASEELSTGLGNDPPVIEVETPPGQVSGVVPLRFTVSDSSGDVVRIRAEFRSSVGGQAAEWRIARPAGLAPSAPTPEWAFDGVVAQPAGSSLVFFWDTDRDFFQLVGDVELRFTAVDPVVAGEPTVTEPFRVHNNEPPTIELYNDQFLVNPDELRGIPIPFLVRDSESDLVRVIFQWRRLGGTFPPLPSTRAELEAILADPVQRRAKRICTEYPRSFEGRVEPIDDERVRLPELGSSASALLAAGLAGRDLEILRPKSVLEEASAGWTANSLSHPVGVLALGDGLEALVLDRPGPGSWRLVRIVLATGVVSCVVATGSGGDPTALAAEVGTPSWPQVIDSVLIASQGAGGWRVDRVTLPFCPAQGLVTPLVAADGSTEFGPIRGLASLGRDAALVTVGGSLLRIDYAYSQDPRQVTLVDNLATPWGIAIDPLQPSRVYLAEHDAPTPNGEGRIITVDLGTSERRSLVPIWIPGGSGEPLPRPRAIALEQRGTRLLVGCDLADGSATHALRVLHLSRGLVVASIREELAAPLAAVAPGSDNLRLGVQSDPSRLLAAGGVEQRRLILGSDFEADSGTGSAIGLGITTVDLPFDPTLSRGRSWRIKEGSTLRGSPGGSAGSFVWDSRDAREGLIQIRGTVVDLAVGAPVESGVPKMVGSVLDAEPLPLGGPSVTDQPSSVAAVDLDGDGDLDLVSANALSDNLTIFFQEAPGVFGSTPIMLGDSGLTNRPVSVAAGDIDGDGNIDLVSANHGSNSLTIFLQEHRGVFGSTPIILGGPGITNEPRLVVVADIDADGQLDIISANSGSNSITIFFQESPGIFDSTPTTLGDPAITNVPWSVVVGDIDGDGNLDVVSANAQSHDITIFFQETPGVFGSPVKLGGPDATNGPTSIVAADADGDGDLDLALTCAGELLIFFQESPRVFGLVPLALGTATHSVVAADIDRDGDLDLVATDIAGNSIVVFFNESHANLWSGPFIIHDPLMIDRPLSVVVADIDGNGDLDIVSANVVSDNLTVILQKSAGVFVSSALSIGGPGVTSDPSSVVAVDIDRDGDLDLISTNRGSHRLALFVQEFPGVFSSATILLGASNGFDSPFDVSVADLDGDGDLDIVTADFISHTLTVYFQGQGGASDAAPLVIDALPLMVGPMAVVAADLDGDGDFDLVSANRDSNNITIFFQGPPGVFGLPPVALGGPSLTGSALSVAVADIDGNGMVDLVSANASSNNLAIFFQASPGVFHPLPIILGGPGITTSPLSVCLADIDGDGDLDIVSANSGASGVTIFLQESHGVFGSVPITLDGHGVIGPVRSVIAADIDGDGDLDLVLASQVASTLTVFLQEASGVFSLWPVRLGGPGMTDGPLSIVAADIDGDGDLDLVSANESSDNLMIFFGGR